MLGRIAVGVVVIVSASADATADGVGNELTVGTSEATAGNPSSAYVSNRLWGSIDLRDVVTLRAEGTFTRDAAAAPGGWSFDNQGGNIFRVAASVDVYPSEHVAFGVEADVSPETETSTSTPITFVNATGGMLPGYAEVQSQSSSYGFGADVEYDSAGD